MAIRICSFVCKNPTCCNDWDFNFNLDCHYSNTATWTDNQIIMHGNTYWESEGGPISFADMTFADWQANGKNTESQVIDPLFVDPEHDNFALQANSPALTNGFVPFDATQAGVTGDASWKALAEGVIYSPIEFAPSPPPPAPLLIDENYEHLALGLVPPRTTSGALEGKGEALGISNETAAVSGTLSLKFTDVPGLTYRFNPHLFWGMNLTRETINQMEGGVTHLEFDLRVENGVEIYHEWREWAAGENYLVGPSLTIVDGILSVAGVSHVSFPTGQWAHFSIDTSQHSTEAGTWDLTVAVPDQLEERFVGLPFGSPTWSILTWVGFISNADAATSFYVDNVHLMVKTTAAPSDVRVC
jgi:hypothetical protein